MSIAYGHFSSALQASVSSGLVNGVTDLYFTIPWYPASYVDRIRIYNTTSATQNIDSFNIVLNGAHARQAGTEFVEDFQYLDGNDYTVGAADNYTAYYVINPPLYYEPGYSRPYIYVKLTLKTAATDDIFYLQVSGRKAYGTSYLRTDSTHISEKNAFSAVLYKNTNGGLGNTVLDVTIPAIGNAVNFDNSTDFNINSANDYIYVGSKKKIDHWEFQVATGSTNCGAMTGQLWTGSAWSSFKLLDNTSSDGTGSLRFSGIVEGYGIGSSTWLPTKLDAALSASLPTDPATTYENQIKAGTALPITMFENPERYWTRFKVASLTDKVVFSGIVPIDEIYD